MNWTKKLWRTLPIALVIVLATAAVTFAANAPHDLKITKIGDVEVKTGAKLPVYCSESTKVEVKFEYKCDSAAEASVELVDSNGKSVVISDKVTGTASGEDATIYTGSVTVAMPAKVVDKAIYSVKLVVTATSEGQLQTVTTAVDNAVEIDLFAPSIGGIEIDPEYPSNNAQPTFTWAIPKDDRAGVNKEEYGYKYLFSNTQTVDKEDVITALTHEDAQDDKTRHSWKATQALGDAKEWYFHIVWADKLGNVSAPATYGPFVVDTKAPELAMTSPKFTNKKQPTVVIEATEPGLGISGVDTDSKVTFTLKDAKGISISGVGNWSASEGKWCYSWTPNEELKADGKYTVALSGVKDKAGNASSLDADFTLDTTKPKITVSAPEEGKWLTNAKPVIEATLVDVKSEGKSGIDAKSIEMWVDGHKVTYSTYNAETGALTYTPGEDLRQGKDIDVLIKVEDVAGNAAEPVKSWFHVDTVAPVISEAKPAKWTNTDTPVVSVKVKEETSGINKDKDKFAFEVTCAGDKVAGKGDWVGDVYEWRPDAALDVTKAYTVSVKVEDIAGNKAHKYTDEKQKDTVQAYPYEWTFEIDTAKPKVSMIPAKDKWSNTTELQPEISASFADVGGSGLDEKTVEMWLDNVPLKKEKFNYTNGVVSYVYDQEKKVGDKTTPAEKLEDGWHDVVIRIKDNAGNLAEAKWGFGVDRVAPVFSDGTPKLWITSKTSAISVKAKEETSGLLLKSKEKDAKVFDFVVKDSLDKVVEGKGDWNEDGTVFTWLSTKAFEEAETYTVRVNGSDNAGNVAKEYAWKFTVDTIAPVIENATPTDPFLLKKDEKKIISADFKEEGSGIDTSTAVMKLDGEAVEATVTAAGIEFEAKNLAEGKHTVTVEVSDRAGLKANKTWTFVVDNIDRTKPHVYDVTPEPRAEAYKVNEISTIAFKVGGKGFDGKVKVSVGKTELPAWRVVAVNRTADGFNYYVLLDGEVMTPGTTMTIEIDVGGEAPQTFVYNVDAERSGYGFGRLRPW